MTNFAWVRILYPNWIMFEAIQHTTIVDSKTNGRGTIGSIMVVKRYGKGVALNYTLQRRIANLCIPRRHTFITARCSVDTVHYI